MPANDAIRSKIQQGCNDCSRFPSSVVTPAVPAHACACGQSYNAANLVKLGVCTIYLLTGVIERDIFALDCPRNAPECRITYDGSDHALWVVNMSTAFSTAWIDMTTCMV